MSKQENRTIAYRYFNEILNAGNLETINELMSDEFIFTLATHPDPFHGPEGFKELVSMLHSSFPDLHIEIVDMLADGDTVVTHWIGSGTHTGGALHTVEGDIGATYRHFKIDGMTWHRMANGKIVESLANEDTVGLLIQLGVIPQEIDGSKEQENKEIVSRYFNEIMTKASVETIDEIIAPGFAFRIPTLPEPVRKPEGFKAFISGLHSAFPDIEFTIDRCIAEGDKVAARWFINGTHLGQFLGVPASGHKVRDQGIDIFRIKNGQIEEIWVNENDFGLMKQLGAF